MQLDAQRVRMRHPHRNFCCVTIWHVFGKDTAIDPLGLDPFQHDSIALVPKWKLQVFATRRIRIAVIRILACVRHTCDSDMHRAGLRDVFISRDRPHNKNVGPRVVVARIVDA